MGATATRLDREWQRLATSDEGRAALARWQEHEHDLRGLDGLQALLERRLDPVAGPAVLVALARLAPDDLTAARTLLQALMPGLMRLAVTIAVDDRAAFEELVALAWERIRTYPSWRPGSVAANVLWDVRKRYRLHRRIERPDHCEVGEGDEFEPSAEEVVLSGSVTDELAAIRRSRLISERSLRLIVRTRLEGEELDEVARSEGVSKHAINQRRLRAERRLRLLAPAS